MESNRMSRKLFLLIKIAEKHQGVSGIVLAYTNNIFAASGI